MRVGCGLFGRILGRGAGVVVVADDVEATLLRAREWVFHYVRGNVKSAVVVEQCGPPIKPSAVIAAVMTLLADQGLTLVPMRAEDTGGVEGGERADHSQG